jgi:glycosyltransferase involved in cell wall biosynthesis
MSERLAIVHVMGWHSRQFGSFERFLAELARRCAEGGMESHFVFQSPPSSEQFVSDAPATFHVVPPAIGPSDPRFLYRLARIVRRLGPSHLHAHHGVDLYNALTVARMARVPRRFATKHSTPGDSRLTCADARHRWIARQVETYFTVSHWVEGNLLEARIPASKLRVCYLGVDVERYRPDPDARADVREELGLAPDRQIVLSTSHLRPGKGAELLPMLAAALRDDPGGVTVLAAGDGPLRELLGQRAQALGLTAAELRLLGVRTDIPRLLAAADAFAFPTTTREGMPLGALEALAAGTPVVATRVSDLGELLPDVALLVEPGDEEALVGAARRLLKERDLAERLGAAGRELAGTRLSVGDAAERYAEVYLQPPPGTPGRSR